MSLAAHADRLLELSHELDTLESSMQYFAGLIADAAVSGHTGTEIFTTMVDHYKETRNKHASQKIAYREMLDIDVADV